MEEKRTYVLPDASEKLSYKFILDSLKEDLPSPEARMDEEIVVAVAPAPSPEPEPVCEAALSIAQEIICGTQAKEDSPQLEIPTEALDPDLPDEPMEATQELTSMDLPAGKKYFRIGEVSAALAVEPYVLRYWESEFKTIKPVKAGSGHRVYSRKDVETLHVIKHLLYVEKFSIKGAKKKLSEKKSEVQVISKPNIKALKEVASELKDIIALIRSHGI